MASKSSIEAGRGHVSLWADDGPLQKGLAAAEAKFQSWGKNIAGIGAGIAAAGAGITAPFLAGLAVFTSWGSEMRSAMRQTGIGFEQLRNLSQGMWASTEQLQPAIAKMSSFLAEAAQGSETANHALRTLGLSITDLAGLSQGDRLQKIAEALGGIADQGQRIALQRQILGRNAQGFNVQGGAAGMRARAARQQHIEGAPTEADQQLAADTSRAFNEMGLAIKAVWREIGAAAAPVMLDFYRIVMAVVIPIREFITANRDTFTAVFRVADAMVTAGTIIGVLGGVIYGASYAFAFMSGAVSIVGGVLGWVLSQAMFVASAFGIVKIATLAWGVVTAASSWIAASALGAWNAVVWLFTGSQTALNVALAGGGVISTAVTAASWAAAIAVGAWNAAVWLATGAYVIFTAALAGFGIVGTVVTALSWIAAGAVAAWNVAVWLVSAAHAVGMATLAGFGAATAAVIALTWLDNAALAVWNAGVWLVNAAHAAGVATLALFAAGEVATTGVTWSYTASLIAAWIWECIVSAGIYLLITAIGLLVVAILAVVLALGGWALVAAAWAALTALIGGSAAAAAAALLASVLAIGAGLVAAIGGIGGAICNTIGTAFEVGRDRAAAAFGGIIGAARDAMGGIMDAMRAGDMELAWEIIKVAALIAWGEITSYVSEQFPIWQDAAIAVWNQISDIIEDVLIGVFVKIKKEWQKMVGEMVAGYYEAWAAMQREMGLVARAERNEERARQARANSTQDAETTQQNANRDTIDRATARRRRDAALAAAAEERDIEAQLAAHFAAGEPDEDAERMAELRQELHILRETARWEAIAAGAPAVRPAGDHGFTGAGRGQMTGSFFADALSGWLGASGQTVQDRQLAQQTQQTRILERIAERLDRMEGAAFA